MKNMKSRGSFDPWGPQPKPFYDSMTLWIYKMQEELILGGEGKEFLHTNMIIIKPCFKFLHKS